MPLSSKMASSNNAYQPNAGQAPNPFGQQPGPPPTPAPSSYGARTPAPSSYGGWTYAPTPAPSSYGTSSPYPQGQSGYSRPPPPPPGQQSQSPYPQSSFPQSLQPGQAPQAQWNQPQVPQPYGQQNQWNQPPPTYQFGQPYGQAPSFQPNVRTNLDFFLEFPNPPIIDRSVGASKQVSLVSEYQRFAWLKMQS
jgi:hypothetical protein